MTNTELKKLKEDFLKAFPLEKLEDMTLDQYTNLNRSDSFCYWIESITYPLGSVWGGSAYKFGIYRFDQRPGKKMTNRSFDNKYAWYTKLGKTAQKAFKTVKESVILAAKYGRECNLDGIEKIENLGHIIKWKIAFLYSDNTIIPYYSLERLRYIAEAMGMKDTDNSNTADIQKFLIEKRKGENIFDYGLKLDKIWKDDHNEEDDDVSLQEEKNIKTTSPIVWMWSGNEETFAETALKAGSTGKGLNYPSFKSKDELGKAYRAKLGNGDVKIPYMYWDIIHNIKVGDIVVVFSSYKEEGKYLHKLYGWGHITSDCIFKMDEDNPLQRTVEWHFPLPAEPIIEDRTNNTLYLHKIVGPDANNIINLLGINNDGIMTSIKPNGRFWLAGYAWGSIDSQMDRFKKEGIWSGSGSAAVNRRIEQLRTGDVLILKATSTKGKNHKIPFLKVRALAIVLSDNIVLNKSDYEVKVKYLDLPEKEFEGSTFGKYRQTIHECDNQEIIDYVLQYLNIDDMAAASRYKEYIELLKETHNLVLTGAPGTGKTFMARAIAEAMGAETAFVQFHPSYDYTDFVEGLRPIEKGDGQIGFERKDGVFKAFCKDAIKNLADSAKSVESLTKEMTWKEQLDNFIEDAIENGTQFQTVNKSKFTIVEMRSHVIEVHNEQNEKTTRVVVNADEILELLTNEVPLNIVRDIRNYYNRKFGTQPDSYTFAIVKAVRAMKKKAPTVEANKVNEKPFVFIIDEINRGEASKIFGELFFAIDPGYRGNKENLVQTQYQNLVPENDVFAKGFYVPENVYILATMNDIDRSVESMDFAMRRRFTWKEVTPDDTESMLDSLLCVAEAKAAMKRLNKAIADTDGLGAAFSIGPSYFLKLAKNDGDFNKLWTMNIEPLLKEYLRGMRKSSDILEKYQKVFFNTLEETTENSELVDED